MNYSEITALALGYADRTDLEVTERVDDFIKIVESRVNRNLKISEMTSRATVSTVDGQEYYGLPTDFAAVRDIELQDSTGGERTTLSYYTPEQMNERITDGYGQDVYTIIANQLQIYPPQSGSTIEIVYYQKVPNLTSTVTTNWLGDEFPDCYVFGILVEINSFVKDAETASLWDARFTQSLQEIKNNDQLTRWSGTSLQIRTV